MSRLLFVLIAGLAIASSVHARKPEWAGEGKPSKEQMEAHKETAKQKGVEMREQKAQQGKSKRKGETDGGDELEPKGKHKDKKSRER